MADWTLAQHEYAEIRVCCSYKSESATRRLKMEEILSTSDRLAKFNGND
jgi:hypothetical protein